MNLQTEGARECMNDSRTRTENGTNLTQPCSGDVRMTDYAKVRSDLKKLAMAHGADTAIGRACHNLLEMTENLAKSSDPDQQIQLKANINRELARLETLRRQVSQ